MVPYFTILFWYPVSADHSNFLCGQCHAEMKKNKTTLTSYLVTKFICLIGQILTEYGVVFPPILAGGIPLSFPLLAAVGVPLNLASSQPIEVSCNGTEGSIQQCQIIRLLQPSAGTIAGVNCTGVYAYSSSVMELGDSEVIHKC